MQIQVLDKIWLRNYLQLSNKLHNMVLYVNFLINFTILVEILFTVIYIHICNCTINVSHY